MNIEEYNRLRAYYHSLEDEILLDFLHNQGDEFLPEAIDLIRAELSSRGYNLEEIDLHSREAETSEKQLSKDELTTVAECNEHLTAVQAKDILQQEGISAYVDDRQYDSHAFHGLKTPFSKKFKILVFKNDHEKAKEILSTFPPLQDELQ